MKIDNIDAPEQLAKEFLEEVPRLVYETVRHLEVRQGHYYPEIFKQKSYKTLPTFPVRMFKEPGSDNIASLLHTIPIYLRDKKLDKFIFEDYKEWIEKEKKKFEDKKRQLEDQKNNDNADAINKEIDRVNKQMDEVISLRIDPLGVYYPNPTGKNPYIELFLSEIKVAVKGNKEHFIWLSTKVLIHELAHAAMDIHNCERTCAKDEKVKYCEPFGRWREESMANAVALNIIKEGGSKAFYEYAKDFISSQSSEYALGAKMEDIGYRDFRSVFEPKVNGVNQVLQNEWLTYVRNSPNWKGLQRWNVLLDTNFVYSFNNKYFRNESELVYDVVKYVLNEYESKNGHKMSFVEFQSIFPNIINTGFNAYELSSKVSSDTNYPYHFSLSDGEYSIYCIFTEQTAAEFVKNTGCKIDRVYNY